ncbi:helix-turn-helix domain-containing protein [Enterococcus canis]|nr:helix-turn-helix domain-containing protein [Enterococcus canis]
MEKRKIKAISVGFIVLAILLYVLVIWLGHSVFAMGVYALILYAYYAFLIAPISKRFLNIKKALKSSDMSNEDLSKMTNIDPEKINLLREENEFTEEELDSLALALNVKKDHSSQKNAKRIIFIVLGTILLVVLVYFLFGE